MAKLKYDSYRVTRTIEELGVAIDQLVNTEEDMRSALSYIASSQGIHHVNTDATNNLFNTLGFPSACQEMIDETITSIKQRAAEIEEYNQEYENASFLEKGLSTLGLFLTKICEGFASAGEQIVDGFASIIGLGAGLISKDAQNSIANFIEKDHVGDYFNNLYDTSLKHIVIKSWASEKGLACNIFKGVGTGLGYAAVLAATGAIGGGLTAGSGVSFGKAAINGATALLSSLPASATIAGVAGIGAGTQAGLKGGMDYGEAFGYGLKYGAIQAGTTVVFTYAFKALAKGYNILKAKMKGTSTSLVPVSSGGTGGAGGSGATGATGSVGTAATPKSGVTFQNPYKGYTCLDDVWDDVVAGKLTKSDVGDIIKNTIGFDDSGLGHTFLSDAANVLRGKAGSSFVPGWKDMAAKMANKVSNVTDDVANSTLTNTIDEGASSTVANATDDVASDATRSQVESELNDIGKQYLKAETKLKKAQDALDDAIQKGKKPTKIQELTETRDSRLVDFNEAQTNFNSAKDNYIKVTSNEKYNHVGLEAKNKGYKMIIGESYDNATSVDGNVTTLRVNTTNSKGVMESRPNWTNASAKVEGQINGRALKDLVDDLPVPTPKPSLPVPTPKPSLPVPTPKPSLPVPTPKPSLPVTIGPTAIVTVKPTIVPTQPVVVPTPSTGNTIIFGVVGPKEVVPGVTITPNPVPPVLFDEPEVTVPPQVLYGPPPTPEVPMPEIPTSAPIVPTPEPIVPTPAPIVPTPAPTAPPSYEQEYAPIPNTGIGSAGASRIGIAPIIAGAVTGIAGAVAGGSLLGRKKDKKEDEEIEVLEMESEE